MLLWRTGQIEFHAVGIHVPKLRSFDIFRRSKIIVHIYAPHKTLTCHALIGVLIYCSHVCHPSLRHVTRDHAGAGCMRCGARSGPLSQILNAEPMFNVTCSA